MNRIEYVLGFLFNRDMTEVALILKTKPEWQAGKLNGIGGKVELGELPHYAMAREFYEETGLCTDPAAWARCLTMQRAGQWIVRVYRNQSSEPSLRGLLRTTPDPRTGEQVEIADVGNLPPHTISNVPWLVAMLADAQFEDGSDSYTLSGRIGASAERRIHEATKQEKDGA